MHSSSDRNSGGQAADEQNKEAPIAGSKKDFSKSSFRMRSAKIKFSQDEPLVSHTENLDHLNSPPSTKQSSPSSPTRQPILSPVSTCIRAADSAVARISGFHDTCDTRGRVNGRLETKNVKLDPHLADGIFANSIGGKVGGALVPPTSTTGGTSLTFVDSCSKTKKAATSESELHKTHRFSSTSGTFLRRRSMRAPKTHTLLSDVVEDSDEGAVQSQLFGNGMAAISETAPNKTSMELDHLTGTQTSVSAPTGDSEPCVGQLLESAAAMLIEQTSDLLEKASQSDASLKVSPHYDKRPSSLIKGSMDDHGSAVAPTKNMVQNCQDVKSWWIKQMCPETPTVTAGLSCTTTAATTPSKHTAESSASSMKESFPPSVFATTSRQGVAGRIRRRAQHGGGASGGAASETIPKTTRGPFTNDPIA